jgi:anti-sigma B factor antagonist
MQRPPDPDLMDARLTKLGEAPLIITQGDIDHGSCRAVEKVLDDAILEGKSVILLDLDQVTYIDSGGLSVLFSAARRLRDSGWIGLVSPNASVRRLLEIVGILADPAFRVFENRAAAQTALLEGTSA